MPAVEPLSWGLPDVRIIKHDTIPQTGSYEVKFTDGRPSVYFDDDPGRRSITGKMTSAQALAKAEAAAKEHIRKG